MITANRDRRVAERLESDAAGRRGIAIHGACSAGMLAFPAAVEAEAEPMPPGIMARRDTAARRQRRQIRGYI